MSIEQRLRAVPDCRDVDLPRILAELKKEDYSPQDAANGSFVELDPRDLNLTTRQRNIVKAAIKATLSQAGQEPSPPATRTTDSEWRSSNSGRAGKAHTNDYDNDADGYHASTRSKANGYNDTYNSEDGYGDKGDYDSYNDKGDYDSYNHKGDYDSYNNKRGHDSYNQDDTWGMKVKGDNEYGQQRENGSGYGQVNGDYNRYDDGEDEVDEEQAENDPFGVAEARKKALDAVFGEHQNTGINFEVYEDIPVEVSGNNVPQPISKFEDIELGSALLANVRQCKYTRPTPVQRYSIPIVVEGRDLMACAQTGSGKTAAFCFPIIANILSSDYQPSEGGRFQEVYPVALIFGPTRELVSQIYDETKKFAFQTGLRSQVVYGGAPSYVQRINLEKGCDILAATPGRLKDFVERERINLEQVRYLVLDEADRMLDMGFEPQIRYLLNECGMPEAGKGRQTLMFSATFPKEIQKLAADFLHDYVFLSVGRVGSSTDLIMQSIVQVESEYDKKELLQDLIKTEKGLTLVFVKTKKDADSLEDYLIQKEYRAASIHGDRTQHEREAALRSFRAGRVRILVATDVASRGLDIPHVNHVIIFDMPESIDDYVHRIGRTGRAGHKGYATAFFGHNDNCIAKPLVEILTETHQEVPDWLQSIAANADSYGPPRGRGRFGARDYRGNDWGGGSSRTYGNDDGGWGNNNDSGWGADGVASRGGHCDRTYGNDDGGWGNNNDSGWGADGGGDDDGWGNDENNNYMINQPQQQQQEQEDEWGEEPTNKPTNKPASYNQPVDYNKPIQYDPTDTDADGW